VDISLTHGCCPHKIAMEAARTADVRRFTYVGSSTVYNGLKSGPYREDATLPLESRNATEAYKKAGETVLLHYADRIGLSRQTVNAIEGGKYFPSLEVAFRIARAFEKAIDEVFTCEWSR
jgi:putative transcriptional regulator